MQDSDDKDTIINNNYNTTYGRNNNFTNKFDEDNTSEFNGDYGDDATKTNLALGSQREKFPLIVKRQLLVDLRDRGGFEKAKLQNICDLNSQQYGQPGSALRRRVQKQVASWKNRLDGRSIDDLIKDLDIKLGFACLEGSKQDCEVENEEEFVLVKTPNFTPTMSRQLAIASPGLVRVPTASALMTLPDGKLAAKQEFYNYLNRFRISKYNIANLLVYFVCILLTIFYYLFYCRYL